jgi:hypothetical protein
MMQANHIQCSCIIHKQMLDSNSSDVPSEYLAHSLFQDVSITQAYVTEHAAMTEHAAIQLTALNVANVHS